MTRRTGPGVNRGLVSWHRTEIKGLARNTPRSWRMHHLVQLSCALGAAGLMACDGLTAPPTAQNTVSLSVGSIAVAPGTSGQVLITVGTRAGGVRLAVTGAPAGLDATLSPDFLPQ